MQIIDSHFVKLKNYLKLFIALSILRDGSVNLNNSYK